MFAFAGSQEHQVIEHFTRQWAKSPPLRLWLGKLSSRELLWKLVLLRYRVVSNLYLNVFFLEIAAHKSKSWSWIQCSRMRRSFGLHTKERCLQLWCGDAGAANWSNAVWQVQWSNSNLLYNIQNYISIWNGFCLPLIYSDRPKPEQSLVRWAKPQLKDMDSLVEMVDPALCGLYAPESVSTFADIVSICVMVCSFLIL